MTVSQSSTSSVAFGDVKLTAIFMWTGSSNVRAVGANVGGEDGETVGEIVGVEVSNDKIIGTSKTLDSWGTNHDN